MAIDWDGLLLGPVMAVFGEEVIYTPRGLPPITIFDAVFDEENYDVVVGDDGQQVNLKKPIIGIRAAVLNGYDPKQNDRIFITRTSQNFIVKNPNPDGHGHIVLELMATS